MDQNQLVALVAQEVAKRLNAVPSDTNIAHSIHLGISNRHVHLCKGYLEILFGKGKELTKMKDLAQPGQYACEEKVIIIGPKGVIEGVRVLGPVRKQTQVEIAQSDSIKLGIKPPVRDSGDLKDSASLTLVGPKGAVTLNEGVIIAARHIHMHPSDAVYFGVSDGERVKVEVGTSRGAIYKDVLIRVSTNYKLEMHLDLDEANAVSAKNNDIVTIVK